MCMSISGKGKGYVSEGSGLAAGCNRDTQQSSHAPDWRRTILVYMGGKRADDGGGQKKKSKTRKDRQTKRK